MKFLFFLLAISTLFSCSDEIVDEVNNPNNNFNIYLVKSSVEDMLSQDVDLESLQLEDTPWVKSQDIEFYDWSAHAFYLSKELEKEELSARNFVVTSKGKRLFMGVFWPMYMSSFPMIPAVMPEDDWWTPKDVIRFNSFGWPILDKLSDNAEFKSELINADLLREGIDVELLRIKREASTTLEYTFKVSNLESENIYILDPNKMGTHKFHYYTNGVSLQKSGQHYWPQDFDTSESDKIRWEWYYKLSPGKSITRTLEMNGYTSLPYGNVKASFRFPGAHALGEKEWKRSDGRIWIGNYLTEVQLTMQ